MSLVFILIIICLLAIAALISATETAITASAPGKLHKLKSEGSVKADLVLKIIKIKEKVISTLLIGNSIANTLCTTIATSLFIEFLGDDLGTIVSSIAMSFLIIVFSEVVPKAIAVAKPEKIALMFTPTVMIFLKLFKPLNTVLGYIVKLFCFIFRIDLTQHVSGEEEVRGVIEHHMHEGNVIKDDRDMLGAILDIRNMVISDIMVHRSKVVGIDINIPVDKILKIALDSNHTRIPVWENAPDNIIGILHIRDLIRKVHGKKSDIKEINIRSLLQDPIFIPDNALVTNQLQIFQEGQGHLAIVVDEYGSVLGIITLEDILEEIVGQIYDEHDPRKNKIIKQADGEYIIDGAVTIRDLNRELEWNIPESEAATIAGFMMHEMKRIPNQGEFFIVDNLKIIVKKKSQNRIKSLRVIVQENQDKASD